MTFLYRSSPLAGGKSISSADSKKRYTFYVSALSNASYVKVLFILRGIFVQTLICFLQTANVLWAMLSPFVLKFPGRIWRMFYEVHYSL